MSRNAKSIPEAKAALDQFKYEVASEINTSLYGKNHPIFTNLILA